MRQHIIHLQQLHLFCNADRIFNLICPTYRTLALHSTFIIYTATVHKHYLHIPSSLSAGCK